MGAKNPVWKADREKSAYTLNVDIGLVIIVHHWVGRGDAWLMTCRGLDFDRHDLNTTDLASAQSHAIFLAKERATRAACTLSAVVVE